MVDEADHQHHRAQAADHDQGRHGLAGDEPRQRSGCRHEPAQRALVALDPVVRGHAVGGEQHRHQDDAGQKQERVIRSWFRGRRLDDLEVDGGRVRPLDDLADLMPDIHRDARDEGVGGVALGVGIHDRPELGPQQALGVEAGIEQDLGDVLDDAGQDRLGRIGLEREPDRRLVEERVLEARRDRQEAARLAVIDAGLALVTRHRLDDDQTAELVLAVSADEEAAQEGVVFVRDEQRPVRRGAAAVHHRGDQAADQKRDAEPDQHRRTVPGPAREVLPHRCDQKTHRYSRSALPVSSRNRVSRFGLLRLVSVTLPPA